MGDLSDASADFQRQTDYNNESHLQSSSNEPYKVLSVSQFSKSKDVRSHDQTNTIVKMKNKRNLFNYQLASNIKTQSL